MRPIRLCCLVLMLGLAGQAAAQRDPMPLYNFIDIPVAVPATAARVKAAIVKGALAVSWNIVQDADGSLIASWSKSGGSYYPPTTKWFMLGDYALKVRITYDATRYSAVYMDSAGLKFRDAAAVESVPEELRARAVTVQEARFKDWAETPYAVKTPFFIHLNYEDDVRALLASVRRQLLAPAL